MRSFFEFVTSSVDDECNSVIHGDRKANNTEHQGDYTACTMNDVVIVNHECDKRNILIYAREDTLHRTAETIHAYDALQCPLKLVI